MKKIIIAVFGSMVPFAVYAQTTALTIIQTMRQLANGVIPLFMALTIAVFLWGIIQFIFAAGDEEKIKIARGHIIYGLIGVFVMVSFWGIIVVFGTTFGFTPGQGTITAPAVGF